MGVRRDLKRAKGRGGPASRARTETVSDAGGTVREARTAPLASPPTEGSTADIPFTNAAEAPGAVVLRRQVDGVWRPVTAAEFAREVTAVAKGLIAAGLEPGGRVAVMSRTRYEWTVLDFAIWAAGGQTVPVYATSSADQVEWIVRDSGARHVVTETAAHTATVRAGTDDHPEHPSVWELDAGALADLTALGVGVSDEEVTKRRTALTPAAVATVRYPPGPPARGHGGVPCAGTLVAGGAAVAGTVPRRLVGHRVTSGDRAAG